MPGSGSRLWEEADGHSAAQFSHSNTGQFTQEISKGKRRVCCWLVGCVCCVVCVFGSYFLETVQTELTANCQSTIVMDYTTEENSVADVFLPSQSPVSPVLN